LSRENQLLDIFGRVGPNHLINGGTDDLVGLSAAWELRRELADHLEGVADTNVPDGGARDKVREQRCSALLQTLFELSHPFYSLTRSICSQERARSLRFGHSAVQHISLIALARCSNLMHHHHDYGAVLCGRHRLNTRALKGAHLPLADEALPVAGNLRTFPSLLICRRRLDI
jgi:hypothetical protein